MSSMDEKEQKGKGEKGVSCPFLNSSPIGFSFSSADPKIGQETPFSPFFIFSIFCISSLFELL